jgi:cell division protein FtsW (lipid II flippase)
MTWLGLVAAVTMITGFGGVSLLSVLGVSLRAQGTDTTRQSWNRRMLALSAVALATALLLAFVLAGPLAGLVCVIGFITLGILVAAMFSTRYPTRLLSVLLFLTVSLAAVTRLPPRGGTFDGVATFVVLGLLLAKMSRLMIRRLENEAEFR